ncbi:hypothetical protein HKD37_13G038009 [Glycine soja]
MDGNGKDDAECHGSTRDYFPDHSHQIFGEVSKVHTIRWKDVLETVWHLVDKDGNYHSVVYNKDLDQPVIVVGWTALRDFYQLTGDHLVFLTHYGKSAFFSYHIQDHLHVQIIPKMTLFIPSSVRFCHLQGLSHSTESYSSLDVPSSMYYFVKDKD